MAPLRLTCCLIVFLLSNAHFHQAAEVDAVSTRKGDFNGVSAVAVAIEQTLRGRKMAVVKQEMVASISSGRCEKEKKKKNKISEEGDIEKEFVAFNADYRAPRHHPPKNN